MIRHLSTHENIHPHIRWVVNLWSNYYYVYCFFIYMRRIQLYNKNENIEFLRLLLNFCSIHVCRCLWRNHWSTRSVLKNNSATMCTVRWDTLLEFWGVLLLSTHKWISLSMFLSLFFFNLYQTSGRARLRPLICSLRGKF